MVGKAHLPNHPTPVIVSDHHGHAKWTVSVPPNYNFPLALDEYASMCTKCVEVANKVDELRGSGFAGSISNLGGLGGLGSGKKKGQKSSAERMHSTDPNFVDVHEAEVAGFLPGSVSIGTLLSQQADDGDIVGETHSSLVDKPVCRSSLTFVLASSDAGLGRTLMLMWIAYAQAQSEGRGFFIDDTRWAYGKYAHIFSPPPLPNCRPPLRHEMLPCPRQARHLVMTIDTASTYFSTDKDGDDESVGFLGLGAGRAAHMFDLAHQGYKALFRLNDDDAKHVTSRVQELKAKTKPISKRGDETLAGGDEAGRGAIVGLHIRRGDRRPVEFQYRDSYVPLNLYADRASDAIVEQEKAQLKRAHRKAVHHPSSSSLMVVASDDPMVYDSFEFAGAARAQEHIRLASKSAAKPKALPRNTFHHFVDETFGWEGGFFAAMFWNLGRSSPNSAASSSAAVAASAASGDASPPAPVTAAAMAQMPVSDETLRIRSLVGRAYMMDLAVLAEASDSIVCAVSATGCRLLAVMMGWDAAIEQGRWINIDGDYGWWAVDM